MKRLKAWLRGVLKVPAKPEPPVGAPGSLRSFRASPKYLRYLLVSWGLKQAAALWGLLFGLLFLTRGEPFIPDFEVGIFFGMVTVSSHASLTVLEVLAWGTFGVQFFVSLVTVLLDYDLRWYLVTDRSLRIREGVLKVQERTQSFANIQNLSIERGPVQRLLGIADLEVRTAGGGEKASSGDGQEHDDLHTAYFRGVDNAEEIRDVILQRLKRYRDAGLGDPDERQPASPEDRVPREGVEGWEGTGEPAGGDRAVREAARELLEAASELHRSRPAGSRGPITGVGRG